jgi:hypothetical protein
VRAASSLFPFGLFLFSLVCSLLPLTPSCSPPPFALPRPQQNAEQMMHDLEAAHGDLPADDEGTSASGSPKAHHKKPATPSHGHETGKHHHAETKEDDVEHAKIVHDHRCVVLPSFSSFSFSRKSED